MHRTYDHWKSTNPADEFSGPEPGSDDDNPFNFTGPWPDEPQHVEEEPEMPMYHAEPNRAEPSRSPVRRCTYWTRSPRNFGNEYDIGIATTATDAAQYRAEGYERINRETALRQMSARGDDVTEIYCTVSINGYPQRDRFQTARTWRHQP